MYLLNKTIFATETSHIIEKEKEEVLDMIGEDFILKEDWYFMNYCEEQLKDAESKVWKERIRRVNILLEMNEE